MIYNLPIYVPKVPQPPHIAIIGTYKPDRFTTFCLENPKSLCNQNLPDSEHFGGYTTFSGTVASGVSGSQVQGYIPEFTPLDGPIPSLLIQFDHEAHTLEIKPELRTTK